MSKIRVYELAKDLNTSSSRLLTKLADLGVQKNNHMSYIEDDELQKLYSVLGIHTDGDSKTVDSKAENAELKKSEGKGVVKVTTVYEPTKDRPEQNNRVKEAVQNENKNNMNKNANMNSKPAERSNRNRQQSKDRTGSVF